MASLSDEEFNILKTIDERRGKYAVQARNILQIVYGSYDYIFTPLKLASNEKIDFDKVINLMNKTIQIFPNPANNLINVTYSINDDYNANMKICNLHGQVLFNTKLNSERGFTKIDCSEYPNGVYYLTLQNDNGVIEHSKFVKY